MIMAEKVIPWWMGYFLIIPLRKLKHDPIKILSPFIKEGFKIMDFGPGMGYFSLPMAQMT